MSLAFKLASDLDTRLSVGESEWVSQPSTGGIACAGRCSLCHHPSPRGRGEGRGGGRLHHSSSGLIHTLHYQLLDCRNHYLQPPLPRAISSGCLAKLLNMNVFLFLEVEYSIRKKNKNATQFDPN